MRHVGPRRAGALGGVERFHHELARDGVGVERRQAGRGRDGLEEAGTDGERT
ncbi:MAG: hypothetical protein HEQ38_12630 [Gemmatimonas sp.]|nr:hypothetical protein [Gemmatimonas sp.]